MQDSSSSSSSVSTNGTNTVSDNLHFPVIGLGASAGGLQALLRFFENMPPAPDMAFVVILHLSPVHQSNAATVLQGVTSMPVHQVMQETTAIEKKSCVCDPA